MKRIKDFLELLKNCMLLLLVGFWWVWGIAFVLFVAYWISTSDLPKWFKFFLLK